MSDDQSIRRHLHNRRGDTAFAQQRGPSEGKPLHDVKLERHVGTVEQNAYFLMNQGWLSPFIQSNKLERTTFFH